MIDRTATLPARLLLVAIAGATIAASSPGCALFRRSESVPAPAAPRAADRSMADDGFTGRIGPDRVDALADAHDAPFSRPAARTVNVFGEVDGAGPASPFSVAGPAGFQQHTYVEEGYDADPCVSPDGQWLLFSSTRHSEHPEIYLQRVEGLAVTQLTADPGDDAFPRFSPDGRRIAFASNRAGNWDIYVMDVDGKNVEPVTRSAAQEIHPSFSPDGRRLVYSALGSRSGQWELWTIDLASGERRMVGYGLFPEWSPRRDRDIITFQRARQRGTRWFSAWTLELVDGEAKHVTEVAFSGNAAIVAPTWSADGRRLAFCTITEPTRAQAAVDQAAGVSTRGSQDVWIVNADGTDRTRLTDGRGVNASPVWSADGHVFFVSDRGGSTESIWSVGVSPPKDAATAGRWPTYPDEPSPPAATSKADDVFGVGRTASVAGEPQNP